MYIVHIASEIAPIAKVGGLADVVYGLSRQLVHEGHNVEIIIPKYDCIDYENVKELKKVQTISCLYKGRNISSNIWEGIVDHLKVIFIDPQSEEAFFQRGTFYDCKDNVDRYTLFSKIALEFLDQTKRRPVVIHCHDWHTAIIPYLIKKLYPQLGGIKTILTIHNLEHQGLSSPFVLERLGLKNTDFGEIFDNHEKDLVNLLKAGILYANKCTTVSATYASEIQTAQNGCGLHELIKHHSRKFKGILNGLDYDYWNPQKDPYLPFHYHVTHKIPDSEKDQALLEAKAKNKAFLKKKLSLEEGDQPLVGCISRLVPQKGIDLIEHAFFHTLEKGGQFVLIGSGQDPKIMARFQKLKSDFASNHNVHFELQYNEELTHQIYAGCDFIIVPSIFEPCGLVQLIALRYGAVPIVRRTGGLADTVFDIDSQFHPAKIRNGYSFEHPNDAGIDHALDRAFHDWKHIPWRWQVTVRHGMISNHSWEIPTKHYLELYEESA